MASQSLKHQKVTPNPSPAGFSNRLTIPTVSMGESFGRLLRPQVVLSRAAGSRRITRSIGFMICAELERATPPDEKWIVQIFVMSDESVRVALELATGDQAEADRGLALISKVVAEAL